MSAAVVTANVGGYDITTHPHDLDANLDYFYFTDGNEAPPGWRLRRLPPMHGLDSRKKAKLPKCWPHFFGELRAYEQVLWVDAGITICHSDFPTTVLSQMNNGLVLSPHPDDRHDAYGESEIRAGHYATQPLDEQVDHYVAEGFPGHNGLYATGVIGWDMKSDEVERIGQEWFLQNVLFSYQDQVSLPYVLWVHQFLPDVLPVSFYWMKGCLVNAHTGPGFRPS